MKHNSLLKSLSKYGVNISLDKVRNHTRTYKAETNNSIITWYTESYSNHEDAYNIYVRRKHMKDNIVEDYFAGTFHDKLKYAINDLLNRNWQEAI